MDETMEESVKKGHESQILKELSQHVALLENLGNLYNERYFMTHIKSYARKSLWLVFYYTISFMIASYMIISLTNVM
jgi:hypothetical protein